MKWEQEDQPFPSMTVHIESLGSRYWYELDPQIQTFKYGNEIQEPPC